MTRLEELEDYAHKNDIEIIVTAAESRFKGCCMVLDGDAAVTLNVAKIRDTADRLCVLAEEVGHIQTDALLDCEEYLSPRFSKWLKVKHEIQAKRWAIAELLPPEKIQSAINERRDLSEHLGVTDEFLVEAIKYYNRQGIEFASPDL